MISVTDLFKEAMRADSKRLAAYIDDGVDEITESDDLQYIKILREGSIGKTVMRYAEASFLGSHTYLGSLVNLGLGVYLPEITDMGSVTISIAAPGVITKTAHGRVTGDKIKFFTTGALPTGITADTYYYVIKIDANSFWIATSYDNAANDVKVTTTGSQSGVQSIKYHALEPSTTPEYIDFGSFKVIEETNKEDTGETTLKMYDRMYEALQKYTLTPTYPITLTDFVQLICTELGWTLADTTFPNSDISLAVELFSESQLSYRDILDMVAEAAGSIIYFGDDDQLHIRQISTSVDEALTKSDVMVLKLNPLYGEINSLSLAMEPQADYIVTDDEAEPQATSIVTYGKNEFKITNNLILDVDRESYIATIFAELLGIKYHPAEINTIGLGYLEIGDRITVLNAADEAKETLVFGIELTIDGGMSEKIFSKVPEKSTTPYQYAGIVGKLIKEVGIKVDKQNGVIEALAAEIASGGIPRQSTAPDSPEVNDLWLDTDDNIIYIYDGADWQATAIAPSTLDNYYTQEEVEARITITADGIISSVEAVSETSSLALAQAEANAEALVDVQSDITTLEQRADGLDVKVASSGGINLLKNSVGLKGSVEEWQSFDENGDLIDADNTATIVQTAEVEENTESGSALRIEEGFINQTFNTLVGNLYTFYTRFKKEDDVDVYISGVSGAIPLTAGGYSDGDWAIFKYQFTASDTTTTIKIESLAVGGYAILGDMVCKIGDVTGWSVAAGEILGRNFRFDKDGFSITSLTDSFKSILDNVKLGVYDTAGGVDRLIMEVSKDRAKLTKLTVQEELIVQRYDNPAKSARFIPTSTGTMFVIND